MSKKKHLPQHPKYTYITEHCDRLRGRCITTDVNKLVVLFIEGKFVRGETSIAEVEYFIGEGFELSNSGKRVLVMKGQSDIWRLYEVAYEEYLEVPLVKALR